MKYKDTEFMSPTSDNELSDGMERYHRDKHNLTVPSDAYDLSSEVTAYADSDEDILIATISGDDIEAISNISIPYYPTSGLQYEHQVLLLTSSSSDLFISSSSNDLSIFSSSDDDIDLNADEQHHPYKIAICNLLIGIMVGTIVQLSLNPYVSTAIILVLLATSYIAKKAITANDKTVFNVITSECQNFYDQYLS